MFYLPGRKGERFEKGNIWGLGTCSLEKAMCWFVVIRQRWEWAFCTGQGGQIGFLAELS